MQWGKWSLRSRGRMLDTWPMCKAMARTQARFRWAMMAGLAAFTLCGAMAQAPVDPQFDPSDVYFQAYLDVRAAEQLEKDGDFLGALKKYEQAGKLFDSVGKFYPDWKSGMVKNRRDLTAKATEVVRGKAGEQFQRERGAIAELEGGVKVGATSDQETAMLPKPANPGAMPKPPAGIEPVVPAIPSRGVLEVDPLQSRRLKEAEAELARLRKMISDADTRSNEAMRNATRVEDMAKRNDTLSRQLRAVEANVLSLRAQMAAAPVHGEMDALNSRIRELEQEREVMAMALNASRDHQMEALSKMRILSADMEIMRKQAEDLRQAEANLNRDLEKERQVANNVVKGQRKQMEMLEKALVEKSKELEDAKGQIAALKNELEESRDAFAEIREERDGLLRERDHMAALLKLNEGDRTQQLIEQNMGLAKDLREANEKVDRLNKDNNAAKDDIVDALRDLAIAKSQINRLQQENKAQTKRIEELSERLKREETALAKGEVSADPAEVEMLREVIRRQLRVQERVRQAKELLMEAAMDLGKEDERLNEAINLFDGAEIALTPEEQKLVADQQVDGEFVSPFARDRTTVGRATADLKRELESYDRAATKAYLAGRLLPTRELFELMVEQDPGHVPALCKLGVVQMKLKQPLDATESFRRAVELDTNNPYAHRMLGYAHMMIGDLAAAELHVKRGVELAPDDAKAYLLLGAIAHRLGETDNAEANFKSAITADPVPSEPYFNLALILAKRGRLEDGRDYYHQALERGAVPDPALQQKLEGKP